MIKKYLGVLLCTVTLGISSCNDIQELNMDFGDHTYTNEYKNLVDAVNNLSLSLKERIEALSQMLQKGLNEIKVSVDANTGAIKVLGQQVATMDENMKESLSTINTSLFNGFNSVCTQIDSTGKIIVGAIDNNGNLLRLQIDTTGKLISAQILSSTEDLIKVMQESTTTLAQKLTLIEALISTGFADQTAAQEAITAAINALKDKVASGSDIKAALEEIKKAISDEGVSLTTKVGLVESAINTGFDKLNGTEGSKGTIETMSEAITGAIGTLTSKVNSGEITIAEYLADMVTALNNINTNTGNINTTLGGTNTALTDIKNLIIKALDDYGVTFSNDNKSVLVTPEIWAEIEKSGINSQLYKLFYDKLADVTPPNVTINSEQKFFEQNSHIQKSCVKSVSEKYNQIQLHASIDIQSRNSKVVKIVKIASDIIYKFNLTFKENTLCTYPNICCVRVYDARGKYQVYGGTNGEEVGGPGEVSDTQTNICTDKTEVEVVLKCYDNGNIVDTINLFVYSYKQKNGWAKDVLEWPDNSNIVGNSSPNNGSTDITE